MRRAPRAWLHRAMLPWSRALARVDPRAFYAGLAIVLGAWTVASILSDRDHRGEAGREAASYDWMMTHRFRVPKPDADIVLLDIDERSLAAMAAEYGRWPWPRDVLATVLAELEAQGAKAIVFDILFSDADQRNPVSERAFEDAIAKDRIAFFPVLRLAPSNDAVSALHAGDLPGLVVSRDGKPLARGTGPTIAVSLPYIDRIVASGRLGTENVDPDADSVVRRYRIHEDIGDGISKVRILSLPARLALAFGWPMPDAPQKALRFNDSLSAYRSVSFSDFFGDVMRRQRARPADEFRDRIVVIGATASGLFDLKGTPISRIHPGMDILATAIDDIRNDRFIDELGPAADIAIAIALLVLMTWLCVRYSHEQLRLAFVIAPGILFAISYVTLNVSRTFVDLSSPASIAFVYFSIVKLYSLQVRRRWGEGELFAPLLEAHVAHWVGCLSTALHPTRRVPGFETRYLNQLRTIAPDVRITSGLDAQSWLGSAFSGVLVATWVERAGDEAAIERAREQARRLFAALQTLSPSRAQKTAFFGEDIIPAEAPGPGDGAAAVPARLNLLRALVSRTVLRMTEDSRR